ncbi:MAG TPA: MogA/MoaB family molybdenum cofactor biosynthesis protein [Gemmatimonadaceae bacterium]|nr:MogA/MoaB family molybdenum cofactor biosynthesis protein [Gemmatimonadaceae bacterium]
MRVAIVTISDSTFTGVRADASGALIRGWCEGRGDEVVSHDTIADDTSAIVPLLTLLCDSATVDLVLTTGGTGLAERDVTPEATRAVIDREAQGIAEYVRATSFVRVPKAALSRGVAGVRGKTLVINLPGSPSGVQDGLAAILPIIDHAIGILTGTITRHDTPAAGVEALK